MILTFKVKHNNDFSVSLKQAKQVAEFSIENRDKLSTKYVKHFGLKSVISNQIIRKYGLNKKVNKVSKVKLIIPNQGIKLEDNVIKITSLKLEFPYQFKHKFSKINQIEIDNSFYYVSVEIEEQKEITPEGWLGIDRNTNGHCAVVACDKTNEIMMLGKKAKHIHTKYSNIRRKLQRLKKYNKLKTIKKKESNIVKDLNHKISSKVVKYAQKHKCGIKLEDLKGIRKTSKQAKSFKYTLNSWNYYQLQTFIEYKSKMLGVPVKYIDPAYTSKSCSKCGLIGNRKDKSFKCPHCGHTSHADINAAWNICKKSEKLLVEPKPECLKFSGSSLEKVVKSTTNDLYKKKDCIKGNTDIPVQEIVLNTTNLRTPVALVSATPRL